MKLVQRNRVKSHVKKILATKDKAHTLYWSWKDDTMLVYCDWILDLIRDLENRRRRK